MAINAKPPPKDEHRGQ